MGQKTHPYGFRLGVIKGWSSNWFAEKDFAELLA
ncbi:MAG: 30S ribosomal protein S3, partial [Candidatus Latescibacterota bacterium]|nr:30S ribosomal protein S3 [Candidatus Latescibacterota bacterium]